MSIETLVREAQKEKESIKVKISNEMTKVEVAKADEKADTLKEVKAIIEALEIARDAVQGVYKHASRRDFRDRLCNPLLQINDAIKAIKRVHFKGEEDDGFIS